jgi:hypothetical protein
MTDEGTSMANFNTFHEINQTDPFEAELYCSDTINCMKLPPTVFGSSVSGNEKNNLLRIYANKKVFQTN